MTGQKSHSLFRPAPVLMGRLVGSSLLWATVAAVCLGTTVALLWALYRLISVDGIDLPSLAWLAARLALVAFVPCFLGRLFVLSRNLADWGFACVGFLATFFGLGILLVFFVQLGLEAVAWFEVCPQLIHLKNRELQETASRYIQKEKDQLYREMERDIVKQEAITRRKFANLDAADLNEKLKQAASEIREEYETQIIPDRLTTLETNAKERQIEAEKSLRDNVSPGALLTNFLTQDPGHVPQDAGIYPALLGSLWLAVITMLISVPIGVGAALYLEEYRQTGWLGQVIQININNLAGVPSVVYGILGAFVFVEMIFKPMENNQAELLATIAAQPDAALNLWDRFLLWLPSIAARNVLGGGMTLALLTLPVVIVSAQEAIRAVPPSIRQGAYALGATQWQVIWHQVLPLARPGILTGTILAVARAIGEAAPLILFGALLLVQQEPSLFSRFTVMPMQIFGWADRPAVVVSAPLEQQLASTVGMLAGASPAAPISACASAAYVPTESIDIWRYNSAMASILLLIVLLGLNAVAIVLRNRAQRKLHW